MKLEELSERLVAWLRTEVEAAGCRGIVFGLSGGVDSCTVAVLVRRAFPDDHLAVIMPIHSDPRDRDDALLAVDKFQLQHREITLEPVFDTFAATLGADLADENSKNLPRSNIKPRLRMATLYYLAQMGVTNTLLLERDTLGSGSTGRSAAIMRSHYSNPVTTRMAIEGHRVIANFEEEIGEPGGFIRTGYFFLASEEQAEPLRRNVELGQSLGLRTEALEPAAALVLLPDGFNLDGIAAIAKMSATINESVENIGARRLHTVLERVLDEISFEATDMSAAEITIDADYITKHIGDLADTSDLSKFIL